MTTFYFVRHCQAKANVDKTFQGHFDGPITEMGKQQLSALSERFKDIHIDIIYTSPLSRAKFTAQAINKYPNVEIIDDERLMEIDVGDMEQMHHSDFSTKYPELSRIWKQEPYNFVAPNGESTVQVYERVGQAFYDILQKNRGKTIAIASHGWALRALVCRLKNIDFSKISDVNDLYNTAVTKIKVDDNNNITFVYENDLSHFDDELKKQVGVIWWR